jgi:hypothetical protein
MKKIVAGVLIFMSMASFSQTKQIEVASSEITAGKSLVDNSIIKGMEYVFPERIHETYLDTTTGLLTVQLRGTSKNGKWLDNSGNVVQYDLKNQKLLWSKKIAYQISNLQQYSNTMIYTSANKSNCLDIHTGKELWEVKNNIYYVDPIQNIAIGYKYKSLNENSNVLEGIDLKNGNVIWKRDLNREYSWNNVFHTNDSTLIVVAAGLHAINSKTGKGWDYNTITGKKDYTQTTVTNAVGVAAGLLTGTFLIATGHNLVRDLGSNVFMDSTYFYFASKEQLAKINKQTGAVAWKVVFPDDMASSSSILVNDSAVFMVNKGLAYMGNRQLNFGKPFVAAYNKQTGKQLFMSVIDAKTDPILSFQIHDKQIYLVFQNRISKYSLETGQLTAEKEFPKDKFGELVAFVGKQTYITGQNGDLLNLRQTDTTKVFAYTNQEKIYTLNDQLEITNTMGIADVSVCYLVAKDLRFIEKDKKTLIVDKEGKTRAEVNATSNAFLIDKMLYDAHEKSYTVIDLKEILKGE